MDSSARTSALPTLTEEISEELRSQSSFRPKHNNDSTIFTSVEGDDAARRSFAQYSRRSMHNSRSEAIGLDAQNSIPEENVPRGLLSSDGFSGPLRTSYVPKTSTSMPLIDVPTTPPTPRKGRVSFQQVSRGILSPLSRSDRPSGSSPMGFRRSISLEGNRKSQLLRHSIARRSTGFSRFSRYSDMGTDDPLGNSNRSTSVYRGYNVGDHVLVNVHQQATEGNSVPRSYTICVNRFGFPPGEGTTLEENRGPYLYILGKVKQVHYEENAVFYTIAREDTGVDVRGDAGLMEPLLSEDGIEAAKAAARKYGLGAPTDNVLAEDNMQHQNSDKKGRIINGILSCFGCFLFPFLWLYDCFVFVIGARLFRWTESCFNAALRHGRLFLDGMKPYECSTRITTVNVIVLCSTWYMFVDQARLAFFPSGADNVLAACNFAIWWILVLELLFEVFIRPEGYHSLILSEKAYMPATVRFISGLHLFVETFSLVFFVPEFVCVFKKELTCDGRPTFSFLNSTMLGVVGESWLESLAGRMFQACIRLRVFSLVRHWKNMWVQKTFLNRQRQRLKLGNEKPSQALTRQDGDQLSADDGGIVTDHNQNVLLQKQREAALINASNIGTALMLTNSYRAVAMMCAILGLFPIITLIATSGVSNSVAKDMTNHLQASNILVTSETNDACNYLVRSFEAWVRAMETRPLHLITAPRQTQSFLVGTVVEPARCVDAFLGLEFDELVVTEMSCDAIATAYDIDVDASSCIVATVPANGNSMIDLAHELGVRVGNFQTVVQSTWLKQDFENGESTQLTRYSVTGIFNQTHAVESAALASFVLQFCLLMTVLGGLSVLRKDAESLVLSPLRSMLKIVARYAKNPLSQKNSSKDTMSVVSDSESEDSSHGEDDDDSRGDGFGTYETEQLITAVGKITDLLRKCWGVAGADIISTNLASREGALSEVFNPTVPGKSVYALFAFAAINGFDHALRCLGGDVMILINDVANVLHGEVYRWGFGDSGQCNKNLGAAFLMVFRIGLVKEVVEKLEEATKVVFSNASTKKVSLKKRNKSSPAHRREASFGSVMTRSATSKYSLQSQKQEKQHDAMADAMSLSLASLPGISTFTDRAVIGMLKSFAGIHRDNKLRAWGRDFRLSAGVGAFSVNMIFGMDAGWAVEGAVGSEYKIDATYLSPHVNMASRMMSACKQYGVTILLSEAVQELMSDAARTKLRNVDRVTVKGSSRIQKIYAYDARHKGADFFLFSRSDEQATLEAERYVPSIWNTDQDLRAMRHHVTDEFEEAFEAGLAAYYRGDWSYAIKELESANELMIETALEEGYLQDEMDESPDRRDLYKSEVADGPSTYLLNFMKSKGGVPPEDWNGWHPLLSK